MPGLDGAALARRMAADARLATCASPGYVCRAGDRRTGRSLFHRTLHKPVRQGWCMRWCATCCCRRGRGNPPGGRPGRDRVAARPGAAGRGQRGEPSGWRGDAAQGWGLTWMRLQMVGSRSTCSPKIAMTSCRWIVRCRSWTALRRRGEWRRCETGGMHSSYRADCRRDGRNRGVVPAGGDGRLSHQALLAGRTVQRPASVAAESRAKPGGLIPKLAEQFLAHGFGEELRSRRPDNGRVSRPWRQPSGRPPDAG